MKETAKNTRQLSANLCYRISVGTFFLEMLAGQGTKPLGIFFFLVTFPLIASPLRSLKKKEKKKKTSHVLTSKDDREIEDTSVNFHKYPLHPQTNFCVCVTKSEEMTEEK